MVKSINNWKPQCAQGINAFTEPALSANEWSIKGGNQVWDETLTVQRLRSPGTIPYAWPRKPLLAQNVVSTSQPLAAQAGLQMLAAGGNAVDAILATAITLTARRAGVERHRLRCLCDRLGRTQAPWAERLGALAGRVDSRPLRAARRSMPAARLDTGHCAGRVSAWVELHAKFGKLPFVELFERAIRYGREGFLVSPTIAGQWAEQVVS